ncbi:MBOAT family O-acyltransferase [Pigmentiphaga litoralis]|uniref:MBOAT family O-acyltransferase n=1 Tax=Pigmentiphaga litoralis TaxID=516702 RepID=UPI003B433024
MVFASLEFLTLFLPAFLVVYALSPARWRNAVLLVASWWFYGWWSPMLLVLFIALTLVGWVGGLAIAHTRNDRQRMGTLIVFVALNLGILCWFKYANIVVETFHSLRLGYGALPPEWERVVLPIGLSFIVLQSLSYLIDVQRRDVDADRSFIQFGAYQAMFVHLIAGPIIRYAWVRKELRSRTVDWAQFGTGARRFMIGMSMKVLVADTLAPLVDLAFALPTPSLADAWLGCLAYGLQLFFDFAGYSAMAIGLGLMLGFHFPENFNRPYLARSIQDFWRRWHLSLSTWLRDYLYIPLGGNRLGALRTYVNLLLTMSIAGLWHGGDNWNFLLWGIAHGLALAGARLWKDAHLPAVPALLSRALTLAFVMLAWTLFRAHDFDAALAMYRGQFGMNGVGLTSGLAFATRPAHVLAIALGILCVIAPAQTRLRHRVPPRVLAFLDAAWPVSGFVLSFGLITSRGAVPFLYFQF